MGAASPKTLLREDVSFLLANRIPHQLANRLFGWFSQIEVPLLARGSIAIWRLFADLDLSEAQTQRFTSLHACFTRELKPGARPVDPDPNILTSPCDGIVGACGRIDGNELIQAKGSPYKLQDLLIDPQLVELYRDGQYVTFRLTPSMYHRFHAPYDCTVDRVTYVSGDTWNLDPIALNRISKLFCKNERAVIRTVLRPSGAVITLVPVAAILVASIRLHFLDVLLNMQYRGETEIPCQTSFSKGQEMGWFQHGSTIIVFAPQGVTLCESVETGAVIRMGRPLMRLPS
ncbi:MAG: phosphatidylserine decarboxylase [Alphaproteobacteria bacterium]|nr:phosphatidylserine decarboxylase [Alphaproteobacteria bacterium]